MPSAQRGATIGPVGGLQVRSPRAAGSETRAAAVARLVGAISIMIAGAIHLQQYHYDYYSVIPTIGTLFLLNFIGAMVVGLALIAPVRRLGRHVGDATHVLAALGAIGIAVPSIVFLIISEYQPVFGLMEFGYRSVLILVLVTEGLATVSLAVYLVLVARARRATRLSSQF
jgi:hypothetical protein